MDINSILRLVQLGQLQNSSDTSSTGNSTDGAFDSLLQELMNTAMNQNTSALTGSADGTADLSSITGTSQSDSINRTSDKSKELADMLQLMSLQRMLQSSITSSDSDNGGDTTDSIMPDSSNLMAEQMQYLLEAVINNQSQSAAGTSASVNPAVTAAESAEN
ncbi:MAG: hypothetical protein Q8930_14400 [Bacillota bacterium]|nr:hypothetical protein [Bacillota bacterium]